MLIRYQCLKYIVQETHKLSKLGYFMRGAPTKDMAGPAEGGTEYVFKRCFSDNCSQLTHEGQVAHSQSGPRSAASVTSTCITGQLNTLSWDTHITHYLVASKINMEGYFELLIGGNSLVPMQTQTPHVGERI